jgi:hypothetical protein
MEVRNAAQAVRAALDHFQVKSLPHGPSPGTAWQEKTLYAEGNMDYAVTGRLFSSSDWKIEVTQDVAPLSRTVYLVTVFNTLSGWYWQGSIKADGSISEIRYWQLLPETESRIIEAELTRKSRIPPPRPGGYGH